MNLNTTLQTVRSWPVEDQFELVFRLWDELAAENWQPVPGDELAAELDRRLAAHESNPADVRTWDQMIERVKKST